MRELTTRLSVGLRFQPAETIHVGELVQSGKDILFQYAESFLETELNIAPFQLNRSREIQKPSTQIFDGLFGVFADSLPDGWGRLLTDRQLLSQGISPNSIGPLQRLALLGANGPGALVYKPVYRAAFNPMVLKTLDEIAEQSQRLLQDQPVHDLDQLFALGGSSGGSRPKVLLGYNQYSERFCPMTEVLPEGYEAWIIKFNSSNDRKDAAEIEFAYAQTAQAAGINVFPRKLFKGNSGRKYFGTKRFDRNRNSCIHMSSAAGLLHDNFRLPAIDYGHVMDAARETSGHRGSVKDVLRLATFNVLTQNLDDHSKNVSFLMDKSGEWQFAPAYDLTYSQSGHGEHSITVAGEGRAPSKSHLLQLAETFEVRNAEEMIEEVQAAVAQWAGFAKETGVSQASINDIVRDMKRIGDRF